jgi:hypothetical protein
VYDKYQSVRTARGGVGVGRSKFYDIEHDTVQHISISKPSSDLCYTCQSNAVALLSTETFEETNGERDFYKQQVEATNESSDRSLFL